VVILEGARVIRARVAGVLLTFFLLRGTQPRRWGPHVVYAVCARLGVCAYLTRESLIVLILGLLIKSVLSGAALVPACGAWSYFRQSRLVFVLFALPGMVDAFGGLLARAAMYPWF
jgi:hypothetical protein